MPLFDDIVHKALGSSIRRDILLSLAAKEKYLTEIANDVRMKPQTVDFHLEMLESIGLVASEVKNGKKFYTLKNLEILRFLRDRKPIPPGPLPRPPHEIMLDAAGRLEKRLDNIDRKLELVLEQLKKAR